MTQKTTGMVMFSTNQTFISRWYPDGDPIWDLPPDKQDRKLIADVRRDLQLEADRLVQIQTTIRG